MADRYIKRGLEPALRRAAEEFPAVVLTGPRQAGKTTLLRRLFGHSHAYRSLELPDVRAAAAADPRGFLEDNPPPVVFDEVQHAPELLVYIKERIDLHRSEVGQYLLTGSQDLLLMEGVTESLAGRAAVLRLLPLSLAEVAGHPGIALPWERKKARTGEGGLAYGALWSHLLRGGYPELVADPGRDGPLWQASYIQTYLERDVRALRQVGDLTLFQSFLRTVAARSGLLLNLSDVARDLGVAVNTARAWLSILEATFQVVILRPYLANVGKRLVKRPKVYFTDTGILCHLAGLHSPDHAAAGPLGGAILETAVVTEVVKRLVAHGEQPRVYFWRTATGAEVDLVVESEGRLVPIEVKLSATPRPAMAAGIFTFRDLLGEQVAAGYVIHPGDVRLPLGGGVTALPLGAL